MKKIHKKKILICTDFVSPFYLGGSANHVGDTYEQFQKLKNLDVTLFCKKPKGPYATKNLNNNKNIYFYSLENFFYFVKNFHKFDSVISHHPTYSILFLFLCKIFSKKFIYFFHGPLHQEYLSKIHPKKSYMGLCFRWCLQRIFLKYSNVCLIHSEYMKNKAIKIYRKTNLKLVSPYVIQALDKKYINPFSIPYKEFYLVNRRLTHRTGVIELIKQFKSSELKNKNLLITGAGELEGLVIKHSKNSSNIKFLGYVDQELLNYLYTKANAVILPSLDLEGFGYVILESYSFGTPCIVSKFAGGGREFTSKHFKNLIYTPSSNSSLIKAMDFSKKIPKDALRKISKKFDINRLIKEYIEVLF